MAGWAFFVRNLLSLAKSRDTLRQHEYEWFRYGLDTPTLRGASKAYYSTGGKRRRPEQLMISTYITSYILYPFISEPQIQAVAGALLHRLFIDKPIPADKVAELVYEEEILLNVIPDQSIIKMAKAEHVNAFFTTGALFLGNFAYYNAFDHEEIGDAAEGSFILVGRNPETTALVEIGGGFENHLFCCYAGEADKDCMRRFGYDA